MALRVRRASVSTFLGNGGFWIWRERRIRDCPAHKIERLLERAVILFIRSLTQSAHSVRQALTAYTNRSKKALMN
jgi:hypothetical protein